MVPVDLVDTRCRGFKGLKPNQSVLLFLAILPVYCVETMFLFIIIIINGGVLD
jgi:hypothetical protein